jgi:hypothetical protein
MAFLSSAVSSLKTRGAENYSLVEECSTAVMAAAFSPFPFGRTIM